MHEYPNGVLLSGPAFKSQSSGRYARIAYDPMQSRWAELLRKAAQNRGLPMGKVIAIDSRGRSCSGADWQGIDPSLVDWDSPIVQTYEVMTKGGKKGKVQWSGPAPTFDDPDVTIFGCLSWFVQESDTTELYRRYFLCWTEDLPEELRDGSLRWTPTVQESSGPSEQDLTEADLAGQRWAKIAAEKEEKWAEIESAEKAEKAAQTKKSRPITYVSRCEVVVNVPKGK